MTPKAVSLELATMGGSRGWTGVLEFHKWLLVFLEILVRIPLEKPIAPRGKSVRRSAKYVDGKKKTSGPPDETFWIRAYACAILRSQV